MEYNRSAKAQLRIDAIAVSKLSPSINFTHSELRLLLSLFHLFVLLFSFQDSRSRVPSPPSCFIPST